MKKNILQVYLNDKVVVEFDRAFTLPESQQTYLDEMDDEMDKGIPIGEDIIESPSLLERSQFVTHTLVDALLKGNNDDANAMCAYLATRVSDLTQVCCDASAPSVGVSIKLVYKQDKSY